MLPETVSMALSSKSPICHDFDLSRVLPHELFRQDDIELDIDKWEFIGYDLEEGNWCYVKRIEKGNTAKKTKYTLHVDYFF